MDAFLKDSDTITRAARQLRNSPEAGLMNLLEAVSSSPAAMQMQRMQADISAIIREREYFYPSSLKAMLELSDAAQQLRSSFSQISPLMEMSKWAEEARLASLTITERLIGMEQFRIPNLLGDWKLPGVASN